MSGNIFKSLATVSGMTMASRVLGFVRQIFMAGIIGAGGNPVADAFWAAFRLPNMFRRLFAEGAFHAAFIPMFQGRRADGGEEEAKLFAEEVLSGLIFILTILTAIVEIAAPAFVFLLASGFEGDPEKFSLTTFYTRIMFPYLMMMSLVGLYSGILNSLGRFAAAAAAPIALNVFMIGALLLYADADTHVSGEAVAWAVSLGGVAQLALLIFGAWRQGYLLRLRMPRLTPRLKRLFALGAPGFISAGAVQINLIVGTNIASQEPGAVSWLMNADQLYQLPLAVIGIALGVVLLPMLSARVKAGDEKGAARALNRSLELAALLALPAAIAFIILGEAICDALFRGLAGDALSLVGVARSAFTPEDVQKTGLALAIFGAGLPAFVWLKIFTPAFFAREDTKTPMYYALLSIAVNTGLSLALFPFFGFLAVAFATSFAAWLQVALLALRLYRQHLFRPSAELMVRFMRILVAVAGLGAFLWFCLPQTDALSAYLWGREWLVVMGLSASGLVLYGVLTYALGAVRLADYKSGPGGKQSRIFVRNPKEPTMSDYQGPMRVLSGIQTSGEMHLGNYIGAIRKFVALQHEYECYYFLADMHAITVWQEPEQLRRQTRHIAASYLAAGIDPKIATVFPQSKVRAHAELAWIFNCVARLGWLDRMTQFKEKAGKNAERSSVGLYTYPVLQAADILVYKATHVPVGEDQKQHLELSRDIAGKFNHDFKQPDFFPLPEPLIKGGQFGDAGARIMSLKDGTKKMSKSDPSENACIFLRDDADTIARKIKKAKSDADALPSEPDGLEGRAEAANLVAIYAALSGKSSADILSEFGGQGFGAFKPALAELVVDKIAPIGEELRRLEADPDHLDSLLTVGAEKASVIADQTVKEVKEIVGFVV